MDPTTNYELMRHFADSWGLLYMMGVFIAVVFFLLRPGAADRASAAARIPLEDGEPK
jgi:cytochrome c oxidase cbb3-type subunit 4